MQCVLYNEKTMVAELRRFFEKRYTFYVMDQIGELTPGRVVTPTYIGGLHVLNNELPYQVHPDYKVMIPVHHNPGFPQLVRSIAHSTPTDWSTRVEVVLHNADNDSREAAQKIADSGAPVSFVELNDPLLRGPYASYQFGLALAAKTTHKGLLWIDADSPEVPKDWVASMENAIEKHPDIAALSGPREHTSHGVTSLLKKLENGYVYPPGYNRIQLSGSLMPHFIAGSSSYNTSSPTYEQALDVILGLPVGDGHFYEACNTLQANSAGLINSTPIPNTKHFASQTDILSKIAQRGRVATASLIAPHFPPAKTFLEETNIRYYLDKVIGGYTPWTKPLIRGWLSDRIATPEALKDAYAATAEAQGFADNPHVQTFLGSNMQSFGITNEGFQNGAAFFDTLCTVAKQTARPTMQDQIKTALTP